MNPTIENTTAEILSPTEKYLRKCAATFYRLALATFVSYQIFDFLFSPVWMHGYLWSLNQPIDVDLSDKSAGFIVDRHLEQCSINERIVYAMFSVLSVYCILRLSGFNVESKSNSWKLFKLAVFIGCATGAGRCLTLQHRLLSALHDGFFSYFHFFFIGLCLTLQFDHIPMIAQTTEKEEKLE